MKTIEKTKQPFFLFLLQQVFTKKFWINDSFQQIFNFIITFFIFAVLLFFKFKIAIELDIDFFKPIGNEYHLFENTLIHVGLFYFLIAIIGRLKYYSNKYYCK